MSSVQFWTELLYYGRFVFVPVECPQKNNNCVLQFTHRVTQEISVQISSLFFFYWLSKSPAAAAQGCCMLDTCGWTESSQSVSITSLTNFTDDSFALRLCTSVSRLSVSLSSLYPGPFFLSVGVSLSLIHPTVPPSGAVDKGGQCGAGPSPGASDSGGGACSGAGPSRSDSIRSMVTGGSKAGRWQKVQSHMHAGGLRFGKWVAHGDRGHAWGATGGTTTAWYGYQERVWVCKKHS